VRGLHNINFKHKMMKQEKKTIILLHGYLQNGEIIRKKFIKLMGKSYCNNYNIIAPNGLYVLDNNKYGWWELSDKNLFCKPHKYKINEEFLDFFKNLISNIKTGNILYVCGFSQGAVALSILVKQNLFYHLKMVLFSGSDIMDDEFKLLHKGYIINKSLHVIGENDTLCLPEYSINFSENFINPKIIYHKWAMLYQMV